MKSPKSKLYFVFFLSCSPALWADEISTSGPVSGQGVKLRKEDEAYLQRHYPFYFAYNAGLSKAQLSFKVPVSKNLPIYFGYTQLMFWALGDDSKPFRDLTYNPELFYRLSLKNWNVLKAIDFGGWNHTSNGKDGPASRSFDKAYVRANFEKEFRRWVISLFVQGSYLYNLDDANENVRAYISPFSLGISFIQLFEAWIDKSELTIQAVPGGTAGERIDRGGYQAAWSFRLGGLDVVPAFYVQYYHGYAETLLNYSQKVDVLRAGFIF
jgi:phospholipase A1/A2